MALPKEGFLKYLFKDELTLSILNNGTILSKEAQKVFDSIKDGEATLAVYYFVDESLTPVVYRLKEVTRENFHEFLRD